MITPKEKVQARDFTVLGIDPGLASTGFAIARIDPTTRVIGKVVEIGISRTEPSALRQVRKTSDSLSRAKEHVACLRSVIEKHRVDLIAYEMASATPYKHPTFSFGVMMGILATLDRPIIEVLPHEVKEAATGIKNASKADIVRWAIRVTSRHKIDWPTSNKQNRFATQFRGRPVALVAEHAADALAAIHAAIATEQFRLACMISSHS